MSVIDLKEYKDITIFECGKEECVKDKSIVLSKKNYHLFHYVLSGEGYIVIAGKKYELSKGDIFYIPTWTDAKYWPNKEDPWVYEWVGFGGEQADKLISLIKVSETHPILKDESGAYKKHFNNIVRRYLSSGYMDITSLGALYELLGEMIFDVQGEEEMSKTLITVKLAKEYIKNNYQFDISITDVAKNVNVTPNYLSNIFQKEENMTTKKYLTMVRMEKAMAFISSGEYMIQEVSKMVGYPNQLHFSTEFRKYYGFPPSMFLKK